MRVLITGVTGSSGRAVARMLLAAGHQVTGLAAQPHRYLDPRVEVVAGAPSDETACARAVAGCDSVLHLADVATAAAVETAAMRAGARLVLPDPARTGTGPAGNDALVVRAAPLAGRRADAASMRTLASLLRARSGESWHLLHHDDWERFLVLACTSERTGVIHLTADGSVGRDDALRVLREAGLRRSRLRDIPAVPVTGFGATTTAADWGFHCGWSSGEALADLGRGLAGRTPRRGGARPGRGRIPLPAHQIAARVPASDNHPLAVAAPDGLEGEFDDRLDERYPVYTATNTSEALPGPLTPLTLDLHVGALRLANETMGRMLAFHGLALEQWTSRVTSVFGHHVYINASIGVLTAENMPGWDAENIRDDVYGNIPRDVVFLPQGRPPMPSGPAGAKAKLTVVSRVLAMARRYRATSELINTASRTEALDAQQIAALTDAQLYARAMLWRDRLNQGWSAAAIGVMLTGAATAIHERGNSGADAGVDLDRLASARTMLAVERLAVFCRADPDLLTLAQKGDVAGARAVSEPFAGALDAALAVVGHRGPGECELANPVFADRPELLVTAAANAAAGPAPNRTRPQGSANRTARMAAGATVAREQARDGVVRVNHCLRLVTREQARRHVAAGRLHQVSDACYLTLDELLHLPADAEQLVTRRRAERERLREIRMPDVIVGRWEPAAGQQPLAPGENLTGLGVSPGVVEGPVKRVVSVDDDIEPGDVLVAAVTDTGHTAMFGYAAAVVTDLGGAASHAAIVAREFEIPCVVDTKVASLRLADGQLVRVDGGAGTVTLVGDAHDPRDAADR